VHAADILKRARHHRTLRSCPSSGRCSWKSPFSSKNRHWAAPCPCTCFRKAGARTPRVRHPLPITPRLPLLLRAAGRRKKTSPKHQHAPPRSLVMVAYVFPSIDMSFVVENPSRSGGPGSRGGAMGLSASKAMPALQGANRHPNIVRKWSASRIHLNYNFCYFPPPIWACAPRPCRRPPADPRRCLECFSPTPKSFVFFASQKPRPRWLERGASPAVLLERGLHCSLPGR